MKNPNESKDNQKSIDRLIEQIDTAGNTATIDVDSHTVSFSNLDKVLWPGTDDVKPVTKRDYARYLIQVSSYILPHLHGRPLTLIRYPNGVGGKSFYQKHWKNKKPEFVETIELFSEHNNADGEFIQCNNLPTLLWLAQLADLELHTAHTRVDAFPDGQELSQNYSGSLENIDNSIMNHPDFIVLDLDPYMYSGKESKGAEPELHEAGFAKVCEVALALKENLDKLKMEAFVKTSGKTGLHIYVPIVRNVEYDMVRALAETIGRHLMSQRPNDITMDWAVKKRTGKIFFDHNMNGRGKTLPSPYSPRNAKEATISTPIEWKELTKKLYPTDFTIWTIPERLKKKSDVWADILNHKTDLEKLKSNK